MSGVLRRRDPDVPQAPLRPSHGPGGSEGADVPPHLHPAGVGCGPAGLHHRACHEGAAGQPDRRPVASGQDHRLRERLYPYGVAGPCGLLPAAVSGLLRLFVDGHRRGEMLGFRLPRNFEHPYAARSMRDFWRRWHISLSSWFRDYVYIPLGGSKKGRAVPT